ncbi:MAG TPA: XRE family transcriptional regulator [Kineosporiaceae bacterium]|nr:XRE family transcriptional regulator [Kineosporiaceae bacterium]
MSPVVVPISAPVLDWALEETNVSNSALAEDLGVPTSLIDGWRQGKAQPTTSQFHKLARALRRPESFFFLPRPPVDADLPAAFRSALAATKAEISPDDAATVRAARRVQRISEWLGQKGYRTASSVPASSYPQDAPELAAQRLGDWLESDSTWERGATANAFAQSVRASLEERGVLVLHSPLDNRGWRGFALQSPTAALITANSHYGPRPRIFTYLHELAHLSTRTESLCPVAGRAGLERWCDEVAGAMLMPAAEVRTAVALSLNGGRATTIHHVRSIANRFNSSLRAGAVRLESLDLARPGLYEEVNSEANVREIRQRGGGSGNPQTAARSRLQRFGAGYLGPLLRAESGGALSRTDVQELLDLSANQLRELQVLAARTYQFVDE